MVPGASLNVKVTLGPPTGEVPIVTVSPSAAFPGPTVTVPVDAAPAPSLTFVKNQAASPRLSRWKTETTPAEVTVTTGSFWTGLMYLVCPGVSSVRFLREVLGSKSKTWRIPAGISDLFMIANGMAFLS